MVSCGSVRGCDFSNEGKGKWGFWVRFCGCFEVRLVADFLLFFGSIWFKFVRVLGLWCTGVWSLLGGGLWCRKWVTS